MKSGIHLGAVVLAAGASSRMGRPKLLLPWNGTTVLGHLLRQWHDLGAQQTAVVCADQDRAMGAELDRLTFPQANRILNSSPELGMHGSVRCAAAWPGWAAGLTHWAIILGDQPHLHATTLRRLLGEVQLDKIYQPSYRGHGRHPVIVPASLFREICRSPSATLKDFLMAYASEVYQIEIDDPGLDLDMDRPEDYLRAQRLAKP